MKDFDSKTYDYNLLVDIFAGRQLYFDGPIYISEENAAKAALEGIRQRKTLNESRNSILSYIKDCQITAEKKNMELSQVVDEGFLGALLGGLGAATFGPKLGEALCKALGLQPKGMLYNLLTSKMFLGALGGFLGMKI